MINRKLTIRRSLAALGAVALTVVVLLAGVWLGGHPGVLPAPLRGGFFESRGLVLVNQTLNLLTTRYYRSLQRSSLIDAGLTGMVASLDDPYSHYLDPVAYRARSEQRRPQISGIGVNAVAEARGLRVLDVFEHSPAAGAGLVAGDVITKVDATSLAGRSDDVGLDLIRGPVGSTVQITFERAGTEHVAAVRRAKVVVPAASWQMLTYHDLHIGHLKLTGFTQGAGDQLRNEVRAALDAGARGLILDLRANGGGLISEAINVASIFIAHGEIMSAQERGAPRRVYLARDDAIAPHIPLAVLVDHGTASSAEIVTGALQDSGRARVVGTETYGKGVFQVTEPLVNGGALDITVGRYFTPHGHTLGGPGDGITPNVPATGDEALAVAERTVAGEEP